MSQTVQDAMKRLDEYVDSLLETNAKLRAELEKERTKTPKMLARVTPRREAFKPKERDTIYEALRSRWNRLPERFTAQRLEAEKLMDEFAIQDSEMKQ